MSADVLIGYNTDGRPHNEFVQSLLAILARDRFRRIVGVLSVESSSFLIAGRNDLAKAFLATEAKWLLQCDDDMILPVDVVDRLLRRATPTRMVGGLCYMLDRGQEKPVMFDYVGKMITSWEPGALVDVGTTGGACLMIHRSVFERAPYPWFRMDGLGVYDQDQGFIMNTQAHGTKVAVDTSFTVGHIKRRVLWGETFAAE